MAHLTQRLVDRINEPGWYPHDNPKGLTVRIFETGTKHYVLRFSFNGKREYLTLGPCNEMSLYAAEVLARSYKDSIKAGIHPTRNSDCYETLEALYADFLDKYVYVYLKPASQRMYHDLYMRYIKGTPLGETEVGQLKKSDFMDLHQSLASSPYQANRLLAVLSSMFTWAEDNHRIRDSWNPVRGIRKFKERERKRLLTPEERERFEQTLAIYPNRQAVMIFRLLFFTGARVSEILSLTWEEVRTDASLIHKHDSKTGERTIYLNAPAEAVLREAKKWSGKSSWVFPNQENWNRPYTYNAIQQHWKRFRKMAELPDLRIHDLRHNFGSAAAKQGMSLPMIGELLGHRQISTTKRYVHFATDHLRAQAERLGKELSWDEEEEAGGAKEGGFEAAPDV